MLFTRSAHAGLANGSITLTFRAWRRPQAKVGGRYRVGPVTIEVDAMERVEVGSISDEDALRAGETDAAADPGDDWAQRANAGTASSPRLPRSSMRRERAVRAVVLGDRSLMRPALLLREQPRSLDHPILSAFPMTGE